MDDMDLEELEGKLKQIRLKPSRQLDGRIQLLLHGVGDEGETESAPSVLERPPDSASPSFVGARVRRRFIAFAASSIALLAAVGAFWFLSRSMTVSPAYAELARALENSQNAEWIHYRIRIWEGSEAEIWYRFRPGHNREFLKADGAVSMFDPQAFRTYEYDPDSRTITVRNVGTSQFLDKAGSFYDFINMRIQEFKQSGAHIEKTDRLIDGKAHTVFSVSREKARTKTRYVVDPSTQRIVRIERLPLQETGSEDPIVAAEYMTVMEIDYPDEGPVDIYALGVPKDAEIIDLTPPQEYTGLRAKVDAARANFAPTYYAVIYKGRVDSRGRHYPSEVDVVYKKNQRYRIERYFDSEEGLSFEERRGRIPPDDMSALEAWTKSHPIFEVFFREDPWTTHVKRNVSGDLDIHRSLSTTGEQYTVESRTWDQHSLPRTPNSVPLPPKKGPHGTLVGGESRYKRDTSRWYFNPARDYAREQDEYLVGKRVDDDLEVRAYTRRISETVVQYAQTPQGQWYAKKIVKEDQSPPYGSSKSMIVIHLDTTRDIPDALLVPESAQSPERFQEDTAALHQLAFQQAIEEIDRRDYWPATPRDVAKAYWDARNAKDLKEVAVFWPGSATWAPRTLEKEKAVKYVFGDALTYGRLVIVPYAAESYYKRHGTYNLKMALSNEGSSKGRYYVTG